MKKLLFLVPVVMIVASACTLGAAPNLGATPQTNTLSSNETLNTGVSNTSAALAAAAPKMKLSDSSYADSAYLISGDLLSADAQKALVGFTLTKKVQADGSTLFSLAATNPEYTSQQYSVQAGQSLYFVDRSLGDDAGIESNQGDDFGIITDANGYIVVNNAPAL